MNQIETELEKESCMEEASKLLVGKLGRNSTEMYQQVVTLLIEDDPQKMLAYEQMTDVDYRHSEQYTLLAGGAILK